MSQPLVSVCVITYNHEPFIAQCLDSILMQQTGFPFEIVVGEDCSTDGTRRIVEAYAAKHPDIIRPIYHEQNVGGARNAYEFCYPMLQGKYVAACEGDDYWTDPLKLQKQVDFMEHHPEFSLCYHRVDRVNAKGGIKRKGEASSEVTYHESEEVFYITPPTASLLFRNCISAIPKEIFEVECGDVFLKAMLAGRGKAADLGFVGAVYRIHPGGVYSSKALTDKFIASLQSRRRMLTSGFFTPAQKKAIRHEMMGRKRRYLLYFLQRRELKSLLRIVVQ